MSLHRRAARRDDNEPPIIEALEAIGAEVRQLSGARVPDLLVGYRGATFLLGVKKPAGPKGGDLARRKDRPTGDERPDTWPGGLWVIVTTPAEAVAVVSGGLKFKPRLVNGWDAEWERSAGGR